MLNSNSLEAVHRSVWRTSFCKPLYDSYSFFKIPGTLLKLLAQEGDALPQDCWRGEYETVICILIDGLGWTFLEKYHEKYPFLSRFFKEGIVSKLTSQFPSTTAAHITTLATGLEVGQTGVFEWFYYEPIVDRVIAPLLYAFAGDKTVGSLQSVVTPDKILPTKTIFQGLKKKGISSHVFQHASIANSIYSQAMFRGSEMVGYHEYSDCMATLSNKLPQKGLFYLYFGDIDAKAHRHGMEAPETVLAITACLTALDHFFSKHKLSKTACILTADHGMTPINPKTTIYLNQEIPVLEKYLRKGRDGRALTPAGSCRDYFLYVNQDQIDEAQELLQTALGTTALVCKTSELIDNHFFGLKPVCETFLKRAGNLVIFPCDNHSIWWYEKGRFEQKFFAMHGGLTRAEMETIFLFKEG